MLREQVGGGNGLRPRLTSTFGKIHEVKEHLPSFKNRVLSVLCTGEDTGQLIADPVFEVQAGRLFLVGVVPSKASQDNWMEGLSTAIAWDTVQDYVVFQSMADYLTRLESGPRKSRKKKQRRAEPARPSNAG